MPKIETPQSNWPPIDLHFIFKESSLKNQVAQTWFFLSISNLSFAGSKNQVRNRQVRPTWFFKLELTKIKCRSIGSEWYKKTMQNRHLRQLLYSLPQEQ